MCIQLEQPACYYQRQSYLLLQMLFLRRLLNNSPFRCTPETPEKLSGREKQIPNESSCCLIWSTFSTAEKLRLASTLPLWNEPQLLPCGSPKLAYWISEMILRPPLHDNSNVVPSYVFPHIVSVAVIWKETSEGFPPISSNKINVFEPLLRNDLGTWYLIQCHPLKPDLRIIRVMNNKSSY